MAEVEELVFLKLGGSLITDKRRTEAARVDVITRLAEEIAAARHTRPALRLVLGHGSGSFGHFVGRRYGTRAGVATAEQWYGFAATADAAARLNRIVVAALLEAGVPAWSIQPSTTLRGSDGTLKDGPHAAVALALDRGLVPVVYGDVMLDSIRGGTIASTEEIFAWLVPHLQPKRLLLAGEVDGIYTADPQRVPGAERIAQLSSSTVESFASGLGTSHGVDVTGGMAGKVAEMMAIVRDNPELQIRICGGLTPGRLESALVDPAAPVGTLIHG